MAANANTNVLDKIAKLLALSEGRGTTEAEASLAAEHVQRLLQDHGLTLAQVETAQGGLSADAKRVNQNFGDMRAMYLYQRNLMATVADNNFCLHRVVKTFVPCDKWGAAKGRVDGVLVRGYMQNQHSLVGRELNVNVTVQTYRYLMEAIERACPFDRRSVDGKRFLEGAVARVTERLTERRHQREAEDEARRSAQPAAGNGSGRELVLSDVYGSEADLNNDTLNNFPPGTTATKRREAVARQAQQQAEHDRLMAEGVDSDVAWYRAYGYGEERAVELSASWKRRSRRNRGGRGRSQNWTQNDARHHDKINSTAYKAGRVAGDGVGLDNQVGASRRKAITG